MATRRYRVGQRRDNAVFEKHNGNTDDYGTPTYTIDSDWDRVLSWPCQFAGAKGGEFLRGRQISAESTHILYGDYSAVRDVSPDMRIKVRGLTLGILDVTDLFGDMREMVVDAKRET